MCIKHAIYNFYETFENAVSENNFVLHVGLVWNPGFVGTGILEAGFGLFSIKKLDN